MTRLSRMAFASLLAIVAGGLPAAPPGDGPTSAEERDAAEVRAYRLTQEKIDRLAAAHATLTQLARTDPALRERMEDDDSDRSIDDTARNLKANYARAAKAIQSAGLAVREFVVLELAFTSDLTLVGMKRQGLLKDYPAGAISPENIAFVEQHYGKLAALADQFDDDGGDED